MTPTEVAVNAPDTITSDGVFDREYDLTQARDLFEQIRGLALSAAKSLDRQEEYGVHQYAMAIATSAQEGVEQLAEEVG